MNNEKPFNITSVCRADLHSIGFNTDTLTDKDMKVIAQSMCDAYLECCFWQDLESIAIDVYKLKQHDM
jgi:hypothetical protein